ncbi:hypothetical protein WNZ15_25865 [Roseibium sp. AS2]|uniref:hypothetical protein n=1 Tax=Roseibium sp. AS2 TaxID=3135781 RepID=UPI00317C86B2
MHTKEFNHIAQAQRERTKTQDLEDYNNELQGNEVGRQHRFLSAEAFDEIHSARTGKKNTNGKLSTLEFLLLNDLAYAQLHQQVAENNRVAQARLTDLQDRIERAAAKLGSQIEATLDQAVTLPDGRKAFMRDDGAVLTTDGKLVDRAIVQGFNWDGRPTYETYLELAEGRTRLEELKTEGDKHSFRLGEIMDALEDEDSPPTASELQSLNDEQDKISEAIDALDSEVSAIDRSFDSQPSGPRSETGSSVAPAANPTDLTF